MLAPALLLVALQQPAGLGERTRVDSLLAAGDVAAALRAAERLVSRHPRDADAQLLLGRAHFARRVIGRYPALAAFRTAARLAPRDPEPLYWQMKVGFYLGSDEGEVIARRAILGILALTPDYRDVWERFQTLYQNAAIRRQADNALARHPHDAVALERRAELAIALEQPLVADSLLGEAIARRGPYLPSYLRRAEACFLAGRGAGYAWYDSALAYADLDSTGAMWDAVWMIASPEEIAGHDALMPGERRAFFERFWLRRDPNLLTAGNERIAEHFQRLAHARRYFRLLHPLNLYHRSPRYRALIAATQRDYLQRLAEADPYPTREIDRMLAASRQLPDVRPGAATALALAGLDARGLIYIRHGPPAQVIRGYLDPLNQLGSADNALDVEGWLYHTDAGTLTIGFRRGSASLWSGVAGGDFIFLPGSRRQAASTRIALRTDQTALPAPLDARAWTAFFKSGELGLTDVYYRAQGDSAAVVLWPAAGDPVRAGGAGLLLLVVPPGAYDLSLDVDSAGVLGRARRPVTVPRFSVVDPGLSSLVLAPAAGLLSREAALAAMPADLVYPPEAPLAAYAEVYGLASGPDGRARYRVTYRFEPARSFPGRLLSGARPIVFEFERDVVSGTAAERLVIEPGRVPAGRYRVSVAVTDLRRNVKSEPAVLDITIR